MRARAGDTLLVKERRAGEGDREAVIIEVWSESGRPGTDVKTFVSGRLAAVRVC